MRACTTWLSRGLDQQLADAALALVVEHWQADDNDGWAEAVAQYGWDAGCRHPDVAETVAVVRAAPGGAADLKAAVDIIDIALATAYGSTARGWTRLEARRAQLAGLLRRATSGRPTGEFDADGSPIYATPHHPTNPRRTRPPWPHGAAVGWHGRSGRRCSLGGWVRAHRAGRPPVPRRVAERHLRRRHRPLVIELPTGEQLELSDQVGGGGGYLSTDRVGIDVPDECLNEFGEVAVFNPDDNPVRDPG